MKQIFWKLSLVIGVLLPGPVVLAQERQTPSGEKVVLLKLGKSDQMKRAIGVTKITLSTEAAIRAQRGGLAETKARVQGDNIIIEFADPLPNKSQTLVLESKLPLDDIGEPFCMVEAGRYDIKYSQEGVASVTLPLTNNAMMEAEGHRRRKSKFWSNIG